MQKSFRDYFKHIIRFIIYRNEQKKVFREIFIRKSQNKLIKQNFKANSDKLIIFIVDGADWFTGIDNITGGILSIASIYEETLKLEDIHRAGVIMITHADAHLLLKHSQFPNNIQVYRFKQLYKYFKQIDNALFHVPECYIPAFNKHFILYKQKLKHLKHIQVNILNQNINLMPKLAEIKLLKSLVNHVTQTTAHEKYSTPEMAEYYGIPLFKLSVFADKKRYLWRPFSEKKNILTVSPDDHPLKEKILNLIQKDLPDWEFRIIKNLKYTDYLSLISQCKFMLTLGEGLDFYFIETIFSGGISFTYYNSDFFPDFFKNTAGVFNDAESLQTNIIPLIKKFDEENNYTEINKRQEELISRVYKHDEYLENLKNFYKINFNN